MVEEDDGGGDVDDDAAGEAKGSVKLLFSEVFVVLVGLLMMLLDVFVFDEDSNS